jgi:hypothetical protein
MSRLTIVCIALLVAMTPAAALAQSVVKLASREQVIVPAQWYRPLLFPMRCDSDGNLYLRGHVPRDNQTPITRISRKGDRVTTLSVDSDLDLRKATVSDFAVSPEGEVYQLAQVGRDVYVATFSSEGTFKSKTKLDTPFWAAHIAPFGSQGFLVTGLAFSEEANKAPREGFTAVFDASGRLVKRLRLPGDVARKKEAASSGSRAPQPHSSSHAKDAAGENDWQVPLLLGTAEAAEDGNVYLLRRASPALLYVLGPSGQVLRKLTVKAPKPGLLPSSMHLARGRIALLFTEWERENPDEILVLLDTLTGERVGEYEVPVSLGGAFACYSDDGFAFITSSGPKLAIEWAAPE